MVAQVNRVVAETKTVSAQLLEGGPVFLKKRRPSSFARRLLAELQAGDALKGAGRESSPGV